MADTVTTNYNFTKPESGSQSWDIKLNQTLDQIDTELKRIDVTA